MDTPVSVQTPQVPIPVVPTAPNSDHRTLITILLLIFISPVGFFVMWFWSKWKTWVKILVTFLLILPVFILGSLFLLAIGMASTGSGSSMLKTSFHSSFVESCSKSSVESGMTTANCNCIADNLVANLDSTKLAKISTQIISSGEAPPELVSAITSCLEQ